jgi:hypothetical protein
LEPNLRDWLVVAKANINADWRQDFGCEAIGHVKALKPDAEAVAWLVKVEDDAWDGTWDDLYTEGVAQVERLLGRA